MTCEEAEELITGLVDGQLREAERVSLESHFKACTKCRFLYAQEQNLKSALLSAGGELRASPELREALLNDPRIYGKTAPSAKSWFKPAAWKNPVLRPAFALTLLFLIAIPSWWLMQRRTVPVSIAAVQSYYRLSEGQALTVKTKDLSELTSALSRTVNGRFRPMGYDFGMMRIEPIGGSVQNFAGRHVLVVRYLGADQSIICYTLLGTEADAPASAAIFHDAEKRLDFYAFSVGNVNAVLHRENDVICILASEMAMTELLNLARAKANPHKHL
ncbi:MAG: anti-sigma factor family protein [Candidatus Binatia bacterium]